MDFEIMEISLGLSFMKNKKASSLGSSYLTDYSYELMYYIYVITYI